MAYRQIHVEIWDDPWFLELDSEGKLLYIYLFSNKRTTLLGLYEISRRAIAFETDLSAETIDRLMAEFEQERKVLICGNWIWIPKLLTRNSSNLRSPKTQAHLVNLLKDIPDSCPLKRQWIEHYNAVVVPQYGIKDTISIPYPEQKIPYQTQQIPSVTATATDPVIVLEDSDQENGGQGSALDAYVKIRGGAVNPLDVDQISDLVDEFEKHRLTLPRGSPGVDYNGEQWIKTAIWEANAARNDRLPSLNYIKAILDRWRIQGFQARRGSAESEKTPDGRTVIKVQP